MPLTELTSIERQILMGAPRARVWRALSEIREFCSWFSAETDATSFSTGANLRLTSTESSCNGAVFYMQIVEITPEITFSWRWHPGAADPASDAMTLVTFRLQDQDGGTLVTVTETGFDEISLLRRAKVFHENQEGWRAQMESLITYVQNPAA